jgi:hypothetical protein
VPGDHRIHQGRSSGAESSLTPGRFRALVSYDEWVERAYAASTRLLGGMIAVLGVAMVASTLARGGGATALGVVLGVMLTLIGCGRLWLARPAHTRGDGR